MKTYIALISTLALAACGGSGTTDTTTPAPQPAPTQPISSDGFATQTSQVGDNFDY